MRYEKAERLRKEEERREAAQRQQVYIFAFVICLLYSSTQAVVTQLDWNQLLAVLFFNTVGHGLWSFFHVLPARKFQ